MAQAYEFYQERAESAAAAAQEAKLDNVRDRELRSEKTWRALAEQARNAAEERAKAAEVRAAQRAEVEIAAEFVAEANTQDA